jgi:hypothetical protein
MHSVGNLKFSEPSVNMSQAGFSDSGFGYGGYKAPVPPQSYPPPPPSAPVHVAGGSSSIPLPPIYGPLRGLLNSAPPDHSYDQQPNRQTVRLNSGISEPSAAGPGSESVVPYSLFTQMLLRMEQLEKENEVLLKVVMEMNEIIEKERGHPLKVFEHPTIGTSSAVPATELEPTPETEGGVPPPWRIKK